MSTPPKVNEGTSAWIRVQTKDKTGALAAAQTVTYRVDCLTSQVSVVAEQTLNAPGADFEIHITSSQNAMINQGNVQEYRRLTVSAVYGPTDRVTAEYDFVLQNLKYI